MDVNYLTVLVCGVIGMVVGFIWYGPLFGKQWMKLMGSGSMSQEEKEKMRHGAGKLYGMQFVLLLGQVYAFAYLFNCWDNTNGVKLGLFIWAGFIVPIIAGNCIWTTDSSRVAWQKFLIQASYQLVMFIIFGLVLNMWR